MPETAPYAVKSIEVLAKSDSLLVREYVYAPGEAAPWHRHTAMTDLTYCISGAVDVDTREGTQTLRPGDRATTPPGQAHRLINRGATDCRLLLVQTGGAYDFLREGG